MVRMVEVPPSAVAVFPSLPQVEILDCWVTSVSTRVEVAPAMEEVVRIQVGAQLVVVETERPIPLRVQAQLTAAVVVAGAPTRQLVVPQAGQVAEVQEAHRLQRQVPQALQVLAVVAVVAAVTIALPIARRAAQVALVS